MSLAERRSIFNLSIFLSVRKRAELDLRMNSYAKLIDLQLDTNAFAKESSSSGLRIFLSGMPATKLQASNQFP